MIQHRLTSIYKSKVNLKLVRNRNNLRPFKIELTPSIRHHFKNLKSPSSIKPALQYLELNQICSDDILDSIPLVNSFDYFKPYGYHIENIK